MDKVDKLLEISERNSQHINDLMEVVSFVKDRMATKEDVAQIDERLQSVEGRLENVEERLERVEGKLQDVDGRLQVVEQRTGEIYNRLDNELDKRKALEVRVTKLEQTHS